MKGFTLTLATALLTAQPAVAADRNGWRIGNDTIHLYYTDLDMNTVAGRAEMLKRVERAAARLCEARLKADEDECVAATLGAAERAAPSGPLALARAEQRRVRWAKN